MAKGSNNHHRLEDDAPGPRLSGYLVRPEDKSWWDQELRRVAKLDGLPAKLSVGYLFSLIAEFKLRLDRRSLAATIQNGHGGPAELTHKPIRRARSEARTTAARG